MPSYTSYKRFMAILDEDHDIEAWITVKGNHIPIMKGQSKGEAIRDFISKKRQQWSQKSDGIIREGNKDYGKAGRYEVFRVGNLDAPRGTIFTASNVITAHNYGEEGKNVDIYHVDIKNPLIIRGKSDVENLKLSWKALFGRDFSEKKPLDEITWPKYDKQIAKKLSDTKYDALITFIDGEPEEVQIPASRRRALKKVRSIPVANNEITKSKEAEEAKQKAGEYIHQFHTFMSETRKDRTAEQEEYADKLYKEFKEYNSVAAGLETLSLYDYYLGEQNEPQSLGNAMNELMNNIKSGEQTFSSRAVERAVKKIRLPETEAAKCAEQIIEYTQSPTKGDRELINKAIWNADSYNGFTYSGIEAEYDRDYKVGDDVGGRLISWSKNWKVAAQFSNKLLYIKKNPGMDISDFSAEPDEEEVLTATDMSFIVKDIRIINGLRVLEVEYKGKKQ